MALVVEDIINLREGKAPVSLDLIEDMTLGRELWLERFVPYYLEQFIPDGGSKVKLLIGEEGSGKTQLLRNVQKAALDRGYLTVFLSARTCLEDGYKLNDLVSLYRLLSAEIDMADLVSALALKVGESLSYNASLYDGQSKLIPYIMAEGFGAPDAAREIRIAVARLLKNTDLSPAAFTCVFTLLKDRLIADDPDGVERASRWLRGEKLERAERRESGLFEILNKNTARRWLDSLLKILILSGHQGLLVLIDDLDVIYERSKVKNGFNYTAANVKDSYELIRQLIDDVDLLKSFMLLLAGRRSLLEDDRRGVKSYEALWMRLQTGLVPGARFNPFCDVVDVDKHLQAQGADFAKRVSRHLAPVFDRYGLKRKIRDSVSELESEGSALLSLKTVVMDNAFLSNNGAASSV